MSEAATTGAQRVRNAIALDDPAAVVVTTEGYLDVFALASDDSGAAGALHHVLRARELEPIIGSVPPPPAVKRFIAVPGPGASVEVLTREEWLAAQEDEPLEEVLDRLTEAIWEWSSTLPQERHPQHSVRLVPGEQAAAVAGESFACDHGLVVIEVDGGSVRFLGEGLAELREGNRSFLTRHAWLDASEETKIDVYPADVFDDAATAFDAYEAFQRLHVLAACARITASEKSGAERLLRRVREIECGLDQGVLEMRRLLEPGASAPVTAVSKHDSIFLAAREVAKRQGIDLVEVTEKSGSAAAFVQSLADASGVRVRSVTLAGIWWKKNSGHLLAFRAEDDAPLVLVPGRGRRYFAHDLSAERVSPVTGGYAANLKPYAFAFYRPFPHEPISVAKLVRFGLAGQGSDIIPVLGFAALIAALALVVPLATAELVDRVIPSAQSSVLLQVGLVLLAVAVVQSLFTLAQNLFLLRTQNVMEHDIQAAVWDRVLGMPIDFFRDFSVGDLSMRVNAINMVYRMLSVGTLAGLLSGAFALLNFVVLFRFSAPLALLALAIVAVAAGFLVLFVNITHHKLEALIPSQRRIMGLIFQLIQGVAKLRTTASEARAFGIWAAEFARFRAIRLLITQLQTQQKVFFGGYQHFGTLLVFVAMAALLSRPGGSGLTTGQFVGFFAAFSALFIGVIGICETLVGLILVPIMFKMAKPILDGLPETGIGKTDPGAISGAIEVSQVSFAYPEGDQVLDDVSFSVPPGSFTAIVGPSGSGKSTLLRMLLGFDAPGSGAILFDDKNLHDLDQRKLRRQFGVVLQGSPLLAGDIFSNIVGVSNGTIDDAWAAARLAGLEEDIHAMPMGMHTAIGEGTSTLSGGQRQRVLIARALVGQPRVIFLDEATSALDNRSQAVVAESLLRMKATRIVIAHRLSTIAQADQIIVMDQGKVVQQGTYDELMDEKGLFAELARRQSVEESEEE